MRAAGAMGTKALAFRGTNVRLCFGDYLLEKAGWDGAGMGVSQGPGKVQVSNRPCRCVKDGGGRLLADNAGKCVGFIKNEARGFFIRFALSDHPGESVNPCVFEVGARTKGSELTSAIGRFIVGRQPFAGRRSPVLFRDDHRAIVWP